MVSIEILMPARKDHHACQNNLHSGLFPNIQIVSDMIHSNRVHPYLSIIQLKNMCVYCVVSVGCCSGEVQGCVCQSKLPRKPQ
jgi:hypothetical protein